MKLLKELEKTRTLMIQSGMNYGFQHEKTLQLSKKLDILMNEYEYLRKNIVTIKDIDKKT